MLRIGVPSAGAPVPVTFTLELMHSQPNVLASVTPGHQQTIFRVCSYLMAIGFFPLLPMAALLPFDLPPKHVAYYITYGVGALAALVAMHIAVNKLRNGCYFTLTQVSLELGQSPKTVVLLADISETLPVFYIRKPFCKPVATIRPGAFNILLLRLRNGERLSLSQVANVSGFDQFSAKLYEALKPTLKDNGSLAAEDIHSMSKPNQVCAHKRVDVIDPKL